MPLLANIIGAGHLGKSIARLLLDKQRVFIGAICNTSEHSTRQALDFIGAGEYCPDIGALPAADLTLIATPDEHIHEACLALANNHDLKSGSVVLHCSGSLTSDLLSPAREAGCLVASIHPMRSFARPDISVREFAGTYCALEGDAGAKSIVRSLFDAIGAITYDIEKDKKSLYHAAGVFASNYLVTLSQQALSCLREAGVEQDMAMRIISNLMQGTVSNLASTLSPECSLTGPIQRGEAATLGKHMHALSGTERETLYANLGLATLALSPADDSKKEDMRNALESSNHG